MNVHSLAARAVRTSPAHTFPVNWTRGACVLASLNWVRLRTAGTSFLGKANRKMELAQRTLVAEAETGLDLSLCLPLPASEEPLCWALLSLLAFLTLRSDCDYVGRWRLGIKVPIF